MEWFPQMICKFLQKYICKKAHRQKGNFFNKANIPKFWLCLPYIEHRDENLVNSANGKLLTMLPNEKIRILLDMF